ncbi:ALP1-like protein [Tanacetum coccineum]
MKCNSTIRQLAYDILPDNIDEYLQMVATPSRDSIEYFSNNDINVLHQSPLFNHLKDGKAREVPFVANGPLDQVPANINQSWPWGLPAWICECQRCQVLEAYERVCKEWIDFYPVRVFCVKEGGGKGEKDVQCF